MKTIIKLSVLSLVLTSMHSLAASYYVSAAGNNTNAGTSTGAPWQTLSKVNSFNFAPGDTINLRCGDTFTGPLTLTSEDAGTSGLPLTIQSYNCAYADTDAPVHATVDGGAGNGIHVTDAGYVTIQDIRVKGAGVWSSDFSTWSGNTGGDGITFVNNTAAKLAGVTINGVEVFGFGSQGIRLNAGTTNNKGFTGPVVINNTVHDNLEAGIEFTSGTAVYAHDTVTVQNNSAINQRGSSTVFNDIVGFGLKSIDGGTVSGNSASQNGAWGTYSGGFQFWNVKNLTISENKSTLNRGEGFRFAGADTLIIERNLTTQNSSAGVNFGTRENATASTGSIFRYNISFIDDLDSGTGGVYLETNSHANLTIVNNSIRCLHACLFIMDGVNSVTVKNNLFSAPNRNFTLYVEPPTIGSLSTLTLNNNAYFTGEISAPPNIYYDGVIYSSGFSAFVSATGHEAAGMFAIPKLMNDMVEPPENMMLRPESPLRGAAATLTAQGTVDFFGNTLPGSGRDIGAHQSDGAPSQTNGDEFAGRSTDFPGPIILENGGEFLGGAFGIASNDTTFTTNPTVGNSTCCVVSVTTNTNGGIWTFYRNNDLTDLTNNQIFIELVTAPAANTGTYVGLQVVPALATDSSIFFHVTGGSTRTLDCTRWVSSTPTTMGSVTYNSTNHKWLRIREASGTTYCEVAAGSAGPWTSVASFATPFSVADVYYGVNAENGSVATTATLDNLNAY